TSEPREAAGEQADRGGGGDLAHAAAQELRRAPRGEREGGGGDRRPVTRPRAVEAQEAGGGVARAEGAAGERAQQLVEVHHALEVHLARLHALEEGAPRPEPGERG